MIWVQESYKKWGIPYIQYPYTLEAQQCYTALYQVPIATHWRPKNATPGYIKCLYTLEAQQCHTGLYQVLTHTGGPTMLHRVISSTHTHWRPNNATPGYIKYPHTLEAQQCYNLLYQVPIHTGGPTMPHLDFTDNNVVVGHEYRTKTCQHVMLKMLALTRHTKAHSTPVDQLGFSV